MKDNKNTLKKVVNEEIPTAKSFDTTAKQAIV
jgi:hypothetical protein